jgi:ABC-2 type transport system ATP-binding protein
MGFMVAGQVVAQGSPSDIKAKQPGQLIDLLTNQTQAASDLLKQRLEAWRVSIFGDHLHVVLDDVDRELPVLQQWLQDAGITVRSAQSIPFSLEDAFIGIVQRANAS